jgi:spore germination protein YaaH
MNPMRVTRSDRAFGTKKNTRNIIRYIMRKGVGSVRYIVQPWETWESMNTIASRFGVTPEGLVAANPILNSVPLGPGMMLTIPGRPEPELPSGTYIDYIVQPGDSIYAIANRFRLNYRDIISQNAQIANPDVIWPGMVLRLVYR